MARARNIKPAFFDNEVLGDLSFAARLMFIGLWTLADREGRLEDRPKRIKIRVFPFDDGVDADELLQNLHDSGFIFRYQGGDKSDYIQILKFTEHQTPHCKEKASTIPAPCKVGASTSVAPPDSLIPDSPSLNPDGEDGAQTAPPKKACRLPDGFPCETDLQWAKANEPAVDAKREAVKFRDYWKAKSGKDATKADWPATWRNWIRKAAEWRKPTGDDARNDAVQAAKEYRRQRNG